MKTDLPADKDAPHASALIRGSAFDPHSPIVCAALRGPYARIICGVRHFDPIMREQIRASGFDARWKIADQGFVNAKGQFLDREQALHVALACGQRKRRCGDDEHQLYSENLY